MAPVKVFGPAISTNVSRVLLCLEEVGVGYEVVDVNFAAGEHKGPEHLERNIPAFQDGGLMLFGEFLVFAVVISNTNGWRPGHACHHAPRPRAAP
ncbi:probable glutathione S-transferase GSTF1 isoform X2 [Setaria italica]|uniref:probable glutathione S-transferase GSTF1 isoform X2 n=1 Tax=Setaria italica TaxID=4555 RepID=UPI000BE5D0C2|nr:probable glutathione S-transferase GSTF1 isoform X2 [Setaria italica]